MTKNEVLSELKNRYFFNDEQLSVISSGLQEGLDISVYAKRYYTAEQMTIIYSI